MSKQLTLSATAAILSMAAFALVAGLGHLPVENADHIAGLNPMIGLSASH